MVDILEASCPNSVIYPCRWFILCFSHWNCLFGLLSMWSSINTVLCVMNTTILFIFYFLVENPTFFPIFKIASSYTSYQLSFLAWLFPVCHIISTWNFQIMPICNSTKFSSFDWTTLFNIIIGAQLNYNYYLISFLELEEFLFTVQLDFNF